jgi:hypothetical protein
MSMPAGAHGVANLPAGVFGAKGWLREHASGRHAAPAGRLCQHGARAPRRARPHGPRQAAIADA